MKIHPVSDLHLEFDHSYRLPVSQAVLHRQKPWGPTEADVIVVAGDAHLGARAPGWLRHLYGNREILYVPGNHEYYGQCLDELDDQLREECQKYGIHFLQMNSVEISGLVFAGCTLWTDFSLFAPLVRKVEAGKMVQNTLNDYSKISIKSRSKGKIRKITWMDTARIHDEHRAWLEQEIARNKGRDFVVVTHHVPNMMTAQEYLRDPVTAGFCSRLDNLVRSSGAKYWICGHTHQRSQARIGETLVVNNSHGYPREDTGFDDDLLLEI